jgi:MFS transporter, DHA2 family, multidrug resistance protein
MKSTPNDGVPLPQRYGGHFSHCTRHYGGGTRWRDCQRCLTDHCSRSECLSRNVGLDRQCLSACDNDFSASLASLGDIIGYRKVYLTGLLVFSVTSLGCAMSDSLWTLTLARVLQGFGAAAVMSVNVALVRLIYPQRHLGRGMGINALIVAVSAAAGPSVAAAILSVSSWPWLFAVNVPIGIAAFICGMKFLPQNPPKVGKPKFDVYSALLNALTFGLLISAISGFAQRQNSLLLLGEVVIMLVVGTLFVRRQLTQEFPLLPVDLLRIPIFSLSVGTSICSFSAQMLALFRFRFSTNRSG